MITVIVCHDTPADAQPPDLTVDAARLLRARPVPPSRFGYIELAEIESETAAARAVARAGGRALGGAYRTVDTNDRPAAPFTDGVGDEPPVVFVNCFACEPEAEETTYAIWREVNEYMVTRPGYRSHRLHRRGTPDAAFGFVNVVEWESAQAWGAAHDERFRQLAMRPDLPYTAYPTLCASADVSSVGLPA